MSGAVESMGCKRKTLEYCLLVVFGATAFVCGWLLGNIAETVIAIALVSIVAWMDLRFWKSMAELAEEFSGLLRLQYNDESGQRKPRQFRLRTLMLVTTTLCIVFAALAGSERAAGLLAILVGTVVVLCVVLLVLSVVDM